MTWSLLSQWDFLINTYVPSHVSNKLWAFIVLWQLHVLLEIILVVFTVMIIILKINIGYRYRHGRIYYDFLQCPHGLRMHVVGWRRRIRWRGHRGIELMMVAVLMEKIKKTTKTETLTTIILVLVSVMLFNLQDILIILLIIFCGTPDNRLPFKCEF